MWIKIILIILGFIFLVKGADFLVTASASIAKKFGLSEILIGLTIVAIGTSLPEIFITITSSLDKHSEIIIGNAIGSCICNFLLVIGIASLIRPVKLDKRIVKVHIPISIITALLILFLGNMKNLQGENIITVWQGVVLLLYSIGYIVYTIYEERKINNKKIDEEIIKEVESRENNNIVKIVLYILLGIIGLKFGSDLVVNNSIIIANSFGLSEKFIGMTIIALGTTLPEIITAIVAAKRDETDLLIGNVTGSNILNLSLLLGLGAIINPLKYSTNFNISMVFLIIITILLLLVAIKNKNSKLNKNKGIILVTCYPHEEGKKEAKEIINYLDKNKLNYLLNSQKFINLF